MVWACRRAGCQNQTVRGSNSDAARRISPHYWCTTPSWCTAEHTDTSGVPEMWIKGGSSPFLSPFFPLSFSSFFLPFSLFFTVPLSFPFPPLLLPSPLDIKPLKFSYRTWGRAVNSSSKIWGGAPAEIKLGALHSFIIRNLVSTKETIAYSSAGARIPLCDWETTDNWLAYSRTNRTIVL